MKLNIFNIALCCLFGISSLMAQDEVDLEHAPTTVFGTFKSTRVINSHSTETLPAGHLDFRITHRFGDIMTDWNPENSWDNLFGVEEAADILVGFEYGITDDLMLGISRTKGGADLRQLMHGLVKYRILKQEDDNSIPLSITTVGTASWATMRKTEFNAANPSLVSFTTCDSCAGFFANRWRYAAEVHFARKFNEVFSLQLSPILIWRNLVKEGESNALMTLNLASRIQLTKGMGIVLDANLPFSNTYWGENARYHIPISFALEFETAGHIFQLNFSNSKGIVNTDYISDTSSNWLNGEFRFGFGISRLIQLR